MLKRREFIKVAGFGGAALAASRTLPAAGRGATSQTDLKEGGKMNYTAKDYTKLLGTPGFSETLLKNHFTLYQGYVTNTNKVLDILGLMVKDGKTATPEFAELKRRLGWEFNGMRLHELYFENLGGKAPLDPASPIGRRIVEQYGDIESWERTSGPRAPCGASAGSSSTRTRPTAG